MTPPLTPQSNCPIDPPTAAKTTSTQLNGQHYGAKLQALHPSYDEHYPLARQYPIQSHLTPPPMPDFLTITGKVSPRKSPGFSSGSGMSSAVFLTLFYPVYHPLGPLFSQQ
ncbi:hypothetical protein DSO57_1021751 [Entomophthora muscae]|uniref:Uncharacterized protein n=1 Tax=Entomophthora muscae TaxID=34485 RepID=A0ACC2S5D4_9FUNG|nr:hypothetical protein DSO57_1021751 [Entomophthora muscae]